MRKHVVLPFFFCWIAKMSVLALLVFWLALLKLIGLLVGPHLIVLLEWLTVIKLGDHVQPPCETVLPQPADTLS